jgi:hypothetical protein
MVKVADKKGSVSGRMTDKKGSYLVEAALVVPLFLLAMLLLVNVIPVIAKCENITYGAAEEMRMEMAKSAFRSDMAALPVLLTVRVKKENTKVEHFLVTKYRYRYKTDDTEDLICIRYTCRFGQPDPFGIFHKIRFNGALMGRAYTGAYYNGQRKEDDTVYVFPEDGKCYHGKDCTHVKANCRQLYLTASIQKHYHPCPNCKSGEAKLGTPVYCFDSYGEAYHLAGCKSVKRYYIDISRKSAIESGYVACSKCGGK